MSTHHTPIDQNEMQAHNQGEKNRKIGTYFNSIEIRVREDKAKQRIHAQMDPVELL